MKLNHTIVAVALGILVGLAWELWKYRSHFAAMRHAAQNGNGTATVTDTISDLVS